MKPSTLLALGIVTALVGGALALDQVMLAPSPKMTDVSLVNLDSGIAKIVVAGQGRQRVVLTKKGSSLYMTSPADHALDPAAARRLLDALRYLTYRRRVSAKQARGLDRPRVTLSVAFVDGRRLTLALGARENRWHRTWLSSSADPGVAFLVESYQAEALDVGVDSLRSRDPFSLSEKPVGKITLTNGERTWVLKDDPLCLVIHDGCVRVDADLAASLQQTLRSLRVSRFLPPGSSLGIRTAQLVVDDNKLIVGGPCPGVADERVTQSALGLACISAAALSRALPKVESAADWVDRHLLRSSPQDVRRIAIRAGATELAIALEGDTWTQEGDEKKAANVGAARLWLQEIHALRAQDVLVSGGSRGAAMATIHIEPAHRTSTEVLALLRRLPGGKVLVRRGQEPALLVVESEALRFFSTAPFHFRERKLLSFDPFLLAGIEVVAGNSRVQMTRTQTVQSWSAEGSKTVDHEAVLALRDAASELRAQRVIADVARAPHRLRPPVRTVTLLVDPPPTGADAPAQKLTVQLGARTKSGACYASIAGDAHVALLAKASCDALYAELTKK